MEERKICHECAALNSKDSSFCTSCGAELTQTQIVSSQTNSVNNQSNDDSEGNKLGVISLILYFCAGSALSFLAYFFQSITSLSKAITAIAGMCPLAGIVVMIVGRVKYPTNKLLKVAMWVIIGSVILGIIAVVLFMVWCYITCSQMDTSGCG